MTFLYSTETHVTDAVTHFTHIQQCRAQGLEWEHKTLINIAVKNNIQVRRLLVHFSFAIYSDFKDTGFTAVKGLQSSKLEVGMWKGYHL